MAADDAGKPEITMKLKDLKVFLKPRVIREGEDLETMRRYRNLVSEPFRILKKEELHIYCPSEIGDLHWIFLKLGHLMVRSGAKRIHLYVRDLSPMRPKLAHEFARMNPLVTDVTYVSDIIETPPCGYIVEPEGYDYALDATPLLASGERIEAWIPELWADYSYPITFPTKVDGLDCSVIYYGDHLAEMNWAGVWGDLDWAALTRALSKTGPIIAVGFECDRSKIDAVKRFGIDVVDVVGKISLRESITLCLGARLVVGSVSGLTILAASRGARSMVLWPSRDARIRLPETMWRNWIDDRPFYRPMAYHSTVADVVKEALSIQRINGNPAGDYHQPDLRTADTPA